VDVSKNIFKSVVHFFQTESGR